MSQDAIVHAYRHLYRHGLRAVQFSKPARYTLRDRLRSAFRKGSVADFEPERIRNTVEFLQYATRESGLEHKIVKNLLFVWWNQADGGHQRRRGKPPYVLNQKRMALEANKAHSTFQELEIKTTAYDAFNHNIRMLNESMGLCLPSTTVRDPK